MYVGEAELLPRRIYGYLNPGTTQQTNKRLKALFESELQRGRKVALDVLAFEPFSLDALTLSMKDLGDKAVRRFIEWLFTMYYSKRGYEVLNA